MPPEPRLITLRERNHHVQSYRLRLVVSTYKAVSLVTPIPYTLPVDPSTPPKNTLISKAFTF